MRFAYGDNKYEFDVEDMTVAETRLIKRYSKLTFKKFAHGLAELDGDALVAVLYLAKKRAGENPRWSDFDDLKITEFAETLESDEDDEEPDDDDLDDDFDDDFDDDDEEEGPTKPIGMTPMGGSSDTSTSSPSTSTSIRVS